MTNLVAVLPGTENERLHSLLPAYADLLPLAVFQRVLGLSAWQLVQARKALGLTRHFLRIDHFARIPELPELDLFSVRERRATVDFWEDLRIYYAKTDRIRRMREIVYVASDTLPASVIGRLFDVSGSAVRKHQRSLGLQRTKFRAEWLLRQFLRGAAPPQLACLEPVEHCQLGEIWGRMREEYGIADRQREDEHLRLLYRRLPAAYFAEKFEIKSASVGARRKELGLPLEKAEAERLREQFLAWKKPPEFPELSYGERVELHEIWRRICGAQQEQKQRKQTARSKTLLATLRAKRTALGTRVPLVACANAACRQRWPRTAEFFDRSKQAADGLDKYCKICQRARKAAPARSQRRPARVFTKEKGERILSILKQNGTSIPSRVFLVLFDINANQLGALRKSAGIVVTPEAGRQGYRDWLRASTAPTVTGLLPEEAERLLALWSNARTAYETLLREDDGQHSIQAADKLQLMRSGIQPELLACMGPLCKPENLSWPKSPEFFRRFGHKRPEDCRCHACANLEDRIERLQLMY